MENRLGMQSLGPRDPRIACGGDDAFAMPIAVALRSASDALASGRRLGVYLLDAGISGRNRARIEASLPADRIAIEWLTLDLDLLGSVPVTGHVSLATYSRLLLPRLLPKEVDRILYLDGDTVVCADLSELWDAPFDGHLALAVQEVAAPYFDSALAIADFARCEPFLVTSRPIENYREFGFEPTEPYFNSGVMLIDLEGWRSEKVADRCFSILSTHRPFVMYWDQYALNVVLAGRWGMLPARWNSSSHLMAIPDASQCAFSREAYEASRRDPAIVHFTGPRKPWHLADRADLPRAGKFHHVRKKTAWRGILWQVILLREFGAQLVERIWIRGGVLDRTFRSKKRTRARGAAG